MVCDELFSYRILSLTLSQATAMAIVCHILASDCVGSLTFLRTSSPANRTARRPKMTAGGPMWNGIGMYIIDSRLVF